MSLFFFIIIQMLSSWNCNIKLQGSLSCNYQVLFVLLKIYQQLSCSYTFCIYFFVYQSHKKVVTSYRRRFPRRYHLSKSFHRIRLRKYSAQVRHKTWSILEYERAFLEWLLCYSSSVWIFDSATNFHPLLQHTRLHNLFHVCWKTLNPKD